MALINFPQFKILNNKTLQKQGYWYVKTFAEVGGDGFTWRPLHRKALYLSSLFWLYNTAAVLSMLFLSSIHNYAVQNQLTAFAIWLGPSFACAIFMLSKTHKLFN